MVNVDQVILAIDGIKNPPIFDGIFEEACQVRRDGFVAQVLDVRGEPFGLIEQPLGQDGIQACKVPEKGRAIGEAIPGHGSLPAEPELVREVFAGQPLCIG